MAYNIFRYGGILTITTLSVLIIIAGCQNVPRGAFSPPPPKPSIFIERGETVTGNASITISYKWHTVREGQNPYVFLNTLEQIQNYKKEVDFLASQLDEVEQRMQVHEQQTKDPKP